MSVIGFAVLTAFLFLMFGRAADFWLNAWRLPLILSLLSLLAACIDGSILQPLRTRLGLLVIALYGWTILCIPFSTYRFGSIEVVFGSFLRAVFCFLLIASLVTTTGQARRIPLVIAVSTLFASGMALAVGTELEGRLRLPEGLLRGPNEFAQAMMLGLMCWLLMGLNSSRPAWFRLVCFVSTAPISYCLMRAGSRAAMVTLIAAGLAMFVKLDGVRKFVALTSLLAIILAGMLLLPDDIRERYTTFLAPEPESMQERDAESSSMQLAAIGSTHSRIYLFLRSIDLTIRHPIFGVGPNQFAAMEDRASVEEGELKGMWLGTHNTYTQFSSEAGLPALGLFVAIFFYAFRELNYVETQAARFRAKEAMDLRSTAGALRIVLFGHCVSLMFEHVAYMPFWTAIVGMIAALANTFRRELPLMEAAWGAIAPAAPTRTSAPFAGAAMPVRS